ncbi:PAS domain S-box protein [Massilia sp. WG5]|uniref:PAS domain S-box protein n=1 Tax=Massilia sp. WG5 TaxID=1707785 RepID=UPI0009E68B5F|nr:PAS domain S-box protein [Massilia sp. WG5]
MSSQSPADSVFPTDVTALFDCQREALRQVETGVQIAQVLSTFARTCEDLARTEVHISFLLQDVGRRRLKHLAAPSVPAPYLAAADGVDECTISALPEPIGRQSKPWYLNDIASESRWPEWRSIALFNGIRALWSWPVLGTANELAGALVCYLPKPAVASRGDIAMLAQMAQTAALILDRQDAAHSRMAAQHRGRQIFDSATDFAIIATDLHGTVTDWNEGAHRVLGWTESEALGFRLHRIFTPEDVASRQPEFELQAALLNGFAPDERWHLRKSGERFWAVGQMTPLKTASGEAIGFVKVMHDRTKQKLAETRKEAFTTGLETQVAERTRERDRIWKNSLDLLLEIGSDGVIHAVNPAWTPTLGYAEDELVTHYFEPFVHPDDVEATVDALARATKEPVDHFEVRLLHKNGSYRWIAWRAAHEDGVVYANGRDITIERIQEEKLNQANEARLQLAMDAGGMGVWEWDMRSDQMIWLHGAAAVHGLTPSEGPVPMPLAGYLAYVHTADQQALADIMTQALHAGQNARAEYRVIWPDGSLHWIEARGFMVLDEGGAPMHMVGISTDITQRKRTEVDLKFLADASAELAELVDPERTLERLAYLAVPHFADWCQADLLQADGTLKRVAIAHVDPNKVELAREFNRKFAADPDASRGIWNAIRTGNSSFAREITDEMLAQSVHDPERRAAMKAVGLRSYIIAPLRVHGKVLGAVSFITAESGRLYDADDVKLAEDLAHRAAVAIDNANLYRALDHSDKAKSVFLATLSHELRNPLAAMTNGLSLMRLVIDDKKRVEQTMKLVNRQAVQLTRLVDDLIDLSRIATGKIELQKQTVNLAAVLADAVDATRQEVEANKHTLSVHVPEQPAELAADSARLIQIFSNLLTNAAKYTDAGGRIDVVLEDTPDEFLVRIRDTGIGIAADMLPQVFKVFTQVVHPVQRGQGGLGIGLSLVEGLVNLHGGRVEAFSAGLGQGSEFVVHLPRTPVSGAEQSEKPDTSVPSEMPALARRKILVVDDNEDAAVMLADLLRTLNQDVDVAHDGLSAVTAAIAMRPDVVLLDIGLPGIDGYEAARRILGHSPGYRPVVIALTGWGEESDRQQAHDAGFAHHLLKPIEFTKLTDILRKS